MSSAETTHPIEWRDDGNGGERGWKGRELFGLMFPVHHSSTPWAASIPTEDGVSNSWQPYRLFPTASAARSFVEKSVKEAAHGE